MGGDGCGHGLVYCHLDNGCANDASDNHRASVDAQCACGIPRLPTRLAPICPQYIKGLYFYIDIYIYMYIIFMLLLKISRCCKQFLSCDPSKS